MSTTQAKPSFEVAWSKLCAGYPAVSWFRDVHLAENHSRIERIVHDLTQLVPPERDTSVIDVGCFNGFLCYLLHLMGYETAGIDALADSVVPERAELMARIRAPFFHGNFNEADPFPDCPKGCYSAAVLGEVFEHILLHPVGFLQQVGSLLKPGGILILTTPNPYTLTNALRILRGRGIIWGDMEFISLPKIDAHGRMTTHEDVHYREYSREILLKGLEMAGFAVLSAQYCGLSPHAKQPLLTRWIKQTPLWPRLQRVRLFGSGHYVVARWQPGQTKPQRAA